MKVCAIVPIMSDMYQQNFLCNQRLWQYLNDSIDELFVITTDRVSNLQSVVDGFYVRIPFKENIENVGLASLLNTKSFVNRAFFSLKAGDLLKKINSKQNLDLIHCFGQFAALSTIPFAKSKRIPSVFTTFNPLWSNKRDCISIKNKIFFSMERKCMSSASKLAVSSDDLASNYVNQLGLEKSRISILPNPIDTVLFSEIQRTKVKKNYIIAFVARMSPYKNQLSLVKAIPKILKKINNIKFIFAGPISDFLYYKEILAEVHRNKLDSVVKVLGIVSLQKLKEIYHEADAFVILSENEAGLPQTCLEAMSSGLPVIVSNRKFFYQNLSNDFAFFVNSESTDEISEAVINLLIDEKKRRAMGHNARIYAENLYSFESYAKKLVSLYSVTIKEN